MCSAWRTPDCRPRTTGSTCRSSKPWKPLRPGRRPCSPPCRAPRSRESHRLHWIQTPKTNTRAGAGVPFLTPLRVWWVYFVLGAMKEDLMCTGGDGCFRGFPSTDNSHCFWTFQVYCDPPRPDKGFRFYFLHNVSVSCSRVSKRLGVIEALFPDVPNRQCCPHGCGAAKQKSLTTKLA